MFEWLGKRRADRTLDIDLVCPRGAQIATDGRAMATLRRQIPYTPKAPIRQGIYRWGFIGGARCKEEKSAERWRFLQVWFKSVRFQMLDRWSWAFQQAGWSLNGLSQLIVINWLIRSVFTWSRRLNGNKMSGEQAGIWGLHVVLWEAFSLFFFPHHILVLLSLHIKSTWRGIEKFHSKKSFPTEYLQWRLTFSHV